MEEYNLNIDLPLDFTFRDKMVENATIQWMQGWGNLVSEEQKNKVESDTFTEFEQLPGKVFKNLEITSIVMVESNNFGINKIDLTFNYKYDDFKLIN